MRDRANDEMPDPPVQRESPFGVRLAPDRTMSFSDAVFSIAMTLLVLDLMIPPGLRDDQVGAALAEAVPQFVAYALSFIVIGRAWMNHHYRFSVIRAFDRRLQWLNLLTLFFVALLPMPTAYLSDYGHTGSPWPVVLYAVVTSGVYVSLGLTWRHAWYAGLIDPDVDEAAYRFVLTGARPVPVVFLLSVPLAFWDPGWAMLSWLLLIPLSAYAGRRSRRVTTPLRD